MGEIADEHYDRMMDEGFSPFSGRERKGRYATPPDSYYRNMQPKKKKQKVKEYAPETFDMSFFPTSIPKPRTVEEPKPVEPDPWATDGDSPF